MKIDVFVKIYMTGKIMDFEYRVDKKDNGRTVKSILKNEFEFSSNLIKKIKYRGQVFCNDIAVYTNHIVHTDDVVKAIINFEEESENVKPVKMDLNILYEDDSFIALDKPSGIIIHPTGGLKEDTLANGLMYYYQSKGYHIKIRPVSRLDRDTTGIIVFAKNQFIHEKLMKQMDTKEYQKAYIGIVHGCPKDSAGTINLPIARNPESIIKREVCPTGAPSVTHYKVIESLNGIASVLHFVLETGRTHQIRVHCQAIGHPLIGETLYSDIPTSLISRQALHSHSVRFVHPMTGKVTEISSPMPQDMTNLVKAIKDGYYNQ